MDMLEVMLYQKLLNTRELINSNSVRHYKNAYINKLIECQKSWNESKTVAQDEWMKKVDQKRWDFSGHLNADSLSTEQTYIDRQFWADGVKIPHTRHILLTWQAETQ